MAAEFAFATLAPLAPPPPAEDPRTAAAEALARAHAEAAALREAARAEGFAAGRAEALAALSPAAEAVDAALGAARVERTAAAARLEAEAVELALALAEKVVVGALAVEPERVLEAVRGALRGLMERERVSVLVHPDDLELVCGAFAELAAGLGGIEHADVQAERRVERGGAVLRTPEGDVDARWETKLARAREVVAAALSEREVSAGAVGSAAGAALSEPQVSEVAVGSAAGAALSERQVSEVAVGSAAGA
jgi:flagellar biosynthesis/type III secretory pathway protein FliH